MESKQQRPLRAAQSPGFFELRSLSLGSRMELLLPVFQLSRVSCVANAQNGDDRRQTLQVLQSRETRGTQRDAGRFQ